MIEYGPSTALGSSLTVQTGKLIITAIALGSAVSLSGCATAQRPSTAARGMQTVSNPNLVMPSAAMIEFAPPRVEPDDHDPRSGFDHFLFARNDDRLGGWPGEGIVMIEVLEIRQRDFLRTINGRPREFSTTFISTTRRGLVR